MSINIMQKRNYINLLLIFFYITILFFPSQIFADADPSYVPPKDNFFTGTVIDIEKTDSVQTLDITLKNSDIITAFIEPYLGTFFFPKVDIGDTVTVHESEFNYYKFTVIDHFRLPRLGILIIIFLFVSLLLLGKKGVLSLFNIALIGLFIFSITIPLIVNGYNAIIIGTATGLFILITSIFLSHGINQNSLISLFSGFISLFLALCVNIFVIPFLFFQGTGTEEGLILAVSSLGSINLGNLLVASFIIGISGILDDVTIIQTIGVEKIAELNKGKSQKELFRLGMEYGREHIVSMVNTLFIIYTAILLPTIIFYLHGTENKIPFWVQMNSEPIVLEFARSIIGSMILMLAVPITTYIATIKYGKK